MFHRRKPVHLIVDGLPARKNAVMKGLGLTNTVKGDADELTIA
jgi:hypothetical protein